MSLWQDRLSNSIFQGLVTPSGGGKGKSAQLVEPLLQNFEPKFLDSAEIPEGTPILQEGVKVLREWNEKRRRFENIARPEHYRAPPARETGFDTKSVLSADHKSVHYALLSGAQRLFKAARSIQNRSRNQSRGGEPSDTGAPRSETTTPPSRKMSYNSMDYRSGSEPEEEDEPTVVIMHTVRSHRDGHVTAHAVSYDQSGNLTIRPSSRAAALALTQQASAQTHAFQSGTQTRGVSAHASVAGARFTGTAAAPAGLGSPGKGPGQAGPAPGDRPDSGKSFDGQNWVRHHWMCNARCVPAPPESQLRRSLGRDDARPSEGGALERPPAPIVAGRPQQRRIPLQSAASERRRPPLKPMRDPAAPRPYTANPLVMRIVHDHGSRPNQSEVGHQKAGPLSHPTLAASYNRNSLSSAKAPNPTGFEAEEQSPMQSGPSGRPQPDSRSRAEKSFRDGLSRARRSSLETVFRNDYGLLKQYATGTLESIDMDSPAAASTMPPSHQSLDDPNLRGQMSRALRESAVTESWRRASLTHHRPAQVSFQQPSSNSSNPRASATAPSQPQPNSPRPIRSIMRSTTPKHSAVDPAAVGAGRPYPDSATRPRVSVLVPGQLPPNDPSRFSEESYRQGYLAALEAVREAPTQAATLEQRVQIVEAAIKSNGSPLGSRRMSMQTLSTGTQNPARPVPGRPSDVGPQGSLSGRSSIDNRFQPQTLSRFAHGSASQSQHRPSPIASRMSSQTKKRVFRVVNTVLTHSTSSPTLFDPTTGSGSPTRTRKSSTFLAPGQPFSPQLIMGPKTSASKMFGPARPDVAAPAAKPSQDSARPMVGGVVISVSTERQGSHKPSSMDIGMGTAMEANASTAPPGALRGKTGAIPGISGAKMSAPPAYGGSKAFLSLRNHSGAKGGRTDKEARAQSAPGCSLRDLFRCFFPQRGLESASPAASD